MPRNDAEEDPSRTTLRCGQLQVRVCALSVYHLADSDSLSVFPCVSISQRKPLNLGFRLPLLSPPTLDHYRHNTQSSLQASQPQALTWFPCPYLGTSLSCSF